jgi:transcription initiation factor IIE alpha subunit
MLTRSHFRCIPCRKYWIKRGVVDEQVCAKCKLTLHPYKLSTIRHDDKKLLRELKRLAEAVANVALAADSGGA